MAFGVHVAAENSLEVLLSWQPVSKTAVDFESGLAGTRYEPAFVDGVSAGGLIALGVHQSVCQHVSIERDVARENDWKPFCKFGLDCGELLFDLIRIHADVVEGD